MVLAISRRRRSPVPGAGVGQGRRDKKKGPGRVAPGRYDLADDPLAEQVGVDVVEESHLGDARPDGRAARRDLQHGPVLRVPQVLDELAGPPAGLEGVEHLHGRARLRLGGGGAGGGDPLEVGDIATLAFEGGGAGCAPALHLSRPGGITRRCVRSRLYEQPEAKDASLRPRTGSSEASAVETLAGALPRRHTPLA